MLNQIYGVVMVNRLIYVHKGGPFNHLYHSLDEYTTSHSIEGAVFSCLNLMLKTCGGRCTTTCFGLSPLLGRSAGSPWPFKKLPAYQFVLAWVIGAFHMHLRPRELINNGSFSLFLFFNLVRSKLPESLVNLDRIRQEIYTSQVVQDFFHQS